MHGDILAMFAPGPWEMMIIGLIALLLFGKRLPEVARSLGKGLVEFKKGVKGIEDDIDDGVRYDHEPASSSASRPVPHEERDEVTAPKFEPPQAAPSESEAAKSEGANAETKAEPQQTA